MIVPLVCPLRPVKDTLFVALREVEVFRQDFSGGKVKAGASVISTSTEIASEISAYTDATLAISSVVVVVMRDTGTSVVATSSSTTSEISAYTDATSEVSQEIGGVTRDVLGLICCCAPATTEEERTTVFDDWEKERLLINLLSEEENLEANLVESLVLFPKEAEATSDEPTSSSTLLLFMVGEEATSWAAWGSGSDCWGATWVLGASSRGRGFERR